MSEHNKGQRCTHEPSCTCSKHCLCYPCLFDRKSLSLYGGMRGRFAAKKWLTGKRAGEIRKDKIIIPFTIHEFRAWLRVVLEDTPHCFYCGIPINIMTISPDHAKPVSRGGSLGRENLRQCCNSCNTAKGSLLPGEFKALLKGLETFTEEGRRDVMKRLRGGILHFGGKPKLETTGEPKASNILVIPKQKEIF